MSEKSKENTLPDTSASKHQIKTPIIVKNPLLSASVTNFDDLSSFPLILPAAPPPAPPATIQPSREPKSLVTVGQSSDIDSETLDEINLNAAPIEDLGPPPIIDTNTNPLPDQGIANDSLLSQAASSFSALPSVASSVFSTFSKRIYAGNSREQTPNIDTNAYQDIDVNSNISQLDAQPPYIQQNPIDPLGGAPIATTPAFSQPFYAPPPPLVEPNFNLNQNNLSEAILPEPPKFYTPTEVPTLSTTAPPTGSAQNTYRLSAKKKLYAPIPGLSEQSQPVPTLSLINTAPTTYDSAAYNYQQDQSQQEDRKSGLFSFTNLVPTGVLQNITGLVQTAAGTLGQSSKSESLPQESAYLQSPLPIGINQNQQQQQTQGIQAVIPPSTYENTNQIFPTGSSPLELNTPQQNLVPQPVPQITSSSTLSSDSSKQSLASNGAANFFSPTFSALTQPSLVLPNTTYGITEVPQVGVNFFNPSTQVPGAELAAPLPSNPPTQPPPNSVGPTSFRLQKGTRLYKSPLTAAETATTFVKPQQREQQQQLSISSQQIPTLFIPFGSSENKTVPQQIQPTEISSDYSLTQPIGKESSAEPKPKIEQHIQAQTFEKNTAQEEITPTVEVLLQHQTLAQKVEGDLNTAEHRKLLPASTECPENLKVLPGTALEQAQIDLSANLQQTSIQTGSCFTHLITQNPTHPPTSTTHIFASLPSPSSSGSVFIQSSTQTPTILPPALSSSSQTATVLPPLPANAVASTQVSTSNFSEIPLRKPELSSTDTISSVFSNLTINTQQPETHNTTSLPPPPPSSSVSGSVNPYRKGIGSSSLGSAQSTLANFFTPTLNFEQGASGDCISNIQPNTSASAPLSLVTHSQAPFPDSSAGNTSTNITSFFSAPLLETQQPLSANEKVTISANLTINSEASEIPEANGAENSIKTPTNIPPPIGFDNIISENSTKVELSATVHRTPEPSNSVQQLEKVPNSAFSNFFGQPLDNSQQESNTKLQTQQQNNFFDSFNNATPSNQSAPGVEITDSNNSSEDQVLQNFFNNPPPKENSSGVGDLQYDLVHSGLGIKAQHTGSLTTASNVVEPPSSACSEFSELNNSSSSQRILPSQSIGVVGEDTTTPLSTQNKIFKVVPEENSEIEEEDLLKKHYNDLPPEVLNELRMANFLTSDKTAATLPPAASVAYSPAVKHWFFKRPAGSKFIWTPFSHYDSALLETSFISNDEKLNIVAVEGGRYDVNISERLKRPVYWEGEPIEVRRCSWFYKASDSKYVPYDEESAQYLESEYKEAAESGVWHKKIVIGRNEQVVFHGPTVIVHFQQLQNTDNWGGTTQTTSRPRVVKRDLDDFIIEQGESQRVDHLLLMVHGIGSACDLKMRSVEEVVDDFRSIAQQLVQSHYKNSTDMGIVGRVEVLPISWHSHLHSEEMGIDEKLRSITLESIPKLRNFTNDTLLDVLFYTSPAYCQMIITTVATEMNTLYMRYRERHPEFTGGVSLAGHSLGSLILFDLLCHQQPLKECEEKNMENPNMNFPPGPLSMNNQENSQLHDVTSQQIGYTVGPAGTGQPFIQYAQLVFHPKKFFALGSPIGMFVTIRGIDKLGLDFRLPTCPGFYNIFHPFDPVAYRIEALVNPDMSGIRPVLIPHHKGRKRMHLELKETMTRVGADLKQRFLDTFKTTLHSVNFLGSRSKKEAEESMEKEVDKVIAMQMEMENDQTEHDISQVSTDVPTTSGRSRANSNSTSHSDTDLVEIDFPLGKLNDSKRIDYVLQEAPLEFFNEYLFALSSHVCYWDSSDTILFVMKEIYSGLGISPDSQVPQQTMTIERPNSRNSVSQSILPPTN